MRAEGGPVRVLPWVVVLAAGATWALSAPRFIVGGDNGELTALYAAGGIAHPPGYPVMVAWLRLFHVLFSSAAPAHGAALANVVVATLSVVALQRACVAWGASPGATAIVSAIYAFSPLAWGMAVHAEVFAMNALFAGILLALAGPGGPLRGAPRAIALAAVAGVALGDHQSIALLAPVGLLGAWSGVRESSRPARSGAVAILTFAVCLVAPYLGELVVARTSGPLASPLWIEEASLRGVWFHFRRGAYGSLALTGSGAAREPLRQLAELARRLVVDTLGLPLIVAVAFARTVARGGRARLAQPDLVALGASFVLAGPALVAAFDLPLQGVGREVVERFYLLPELVSCIPGALAIDALARRAVARSPIAVAAAGIVVAAQVVVGRDARIERGRPTVELYVANTLRAAPPNAILVGTGDSRWGGFLYARYAIGLRPDVAFITPLLLRQAWYRRLARALTGVDFETPSGGPIGPKTAVARLLATRRPVLYTDWPDPKVADTSHYAIGTLMRVLGPGDAPPSSDALEAMNEEAFATFTLEPTPPSDQDGWGYALQPDYARPWGELGQRFQAEGRPDDARRCFLRAAALAPWVVARNVAAR